MKREKKWRYFCEFCGRDSGSASHMSRHEKVCTRNPARVCGMCKAAGLSQASIDDLVAAVRRDEAKGNILNDECGVDELHEVASGCPACMLAAIRLGAPDAYFDFSYQSRKNAFWRERALS